MKMNREELLMEENRLLEEEMEFESKLRNIRNRKERLTEMLEHAVAHHYEMERDDALRELGYLDHYQLQNRLHEQRIRLSHNLAILRDQPPVGRWKLAGAALPILGILVSIALIFYCLFFPSSLSESRFELIISFSIVFGFISGYIAFQKIELLRRDFLSIRRNQELLRKGISLLELQKNLEIAEKGNVGD